MFGGWEDGMVGNTLPGVCQPASHLLIWVVLFVSIPATSNEGNERFSNAITKQRIEIKQRNKNGKLGNPC